MSSRIEESQLLEGLSVVHLKLFGIWEAINTYLTTGRRSRGLILLTAFALLYALPYVSFQVLSAFYIPLNIETITFLCLNCVPCIQVFLKVTVFWFRIGDQCEIFNLLKRDFLSCIPQHKMSEVEKIFKKDSKKCSAYCFLDFGVMIACITTWVAIPGVPGQDYTGAVANKIMGGWYPFPFSRSPCYEGVFIYEMVLMTVYGLLISLFHCVMIQPLLCLCAQFKAFGYHIATLKANGVVRSKAPSSTEYLNEELRGILLDYESLLRYAAAIQDNLNLLVTVILGTEIVVLIIGILQFINYDGGDPLFVVRFLTYLSYEATEVILICVGSSALNTASTDIQFALYSSDWYLADKKFAVAAQMMMIRAMKPLTLTAIKMYPVSMEILVGLFQFTYTAAMVLSGSRD